MQTAGTGRACHRHRLGHRPGDHCPPDRILSCWASRSARWQPCLRDGLQQQRRHGDRDVREHAGHDGRRRQRAARRGRQPDGTRVFVTLQNDGTVQAINTTTNTTVGPAVATGQVPSACSSAPDGLMLYVANQGGSDNVAIFYVDPNTTGMSSRGTIATGDNPTLRICRNGNGLLGLTELRRQLNGRPRVSLAAAPVSHGGHVDGQTTTCRSLPMTLGTMAATSIPTARLILAGAITATVRVPDGAGTLVLPGTKASPGPRSSWPGRFGSRIARREPCRHDWRRLHSRDRHGHRHRQRASGGTLSPGVGPGIINTGTLVLTEGSALAIELNGRTVRAAIA